MFVFRRIPACRIVFLALAFGVPCLQGQTNPYTAPVVEVPAFDHEKLALLDVERQKLATNIAAFAVNSVIKKRSV